MSIFRKTLSMEHKELSETYEFLDSCDKYKDTDTLPIKVLVDPFKDIIFRFTRISISQEEKNLVVNFDSEILELPEGKYTSVKDQEFVDFMGNILYDIVVNRKDITTSPEIQDVPVDLEADVHEEPYGKTNP